MTQTAESEMTMPFGKHKGKPISELPPSYIGWALENLTALSPDLQQAFQARLDAGQSRIEQYRATPSKELCSQIIHLGMLELLHQKPHSQQETDEVQKACNWMRSQLHLGL